MCGFTDPDNRRTYPWGKEDVVLVDFHRDMIRIHKENEALRTGSLKLLQGEKDILCYGRFNRTQQFVVILNNSDEKKEITKEVWSIGIPKNCKMERLIITTELAIRSCRKNMKWKMEGSPSRCCLIRLRC